MEHSWQYTLFSWGAFTAIGYAGYHYYFRGNKRAGQNTANRATTQSQPQESKQGRGRRRDAQLSDVSGNERGIKRKAKKPEPPSNRFEALRIEGADDEPDTEDNDKEWATQLKNLRKGTNLEAPKRKEAFAKTVKQSSASRTPELSATSSTTGADADDDLSPAVSPAFGASKTVASGNDVSDMLEPAGAAPSVLRVAPKETKPKGVAEDGWNLAGKKDKPKKQAAAADGEAETKKQRQNKRKADEQKAQREADERARQVLLEKQRRTAREARGEAPKNGVTSAPAVNKWSSGAPAVKSQDEPLLDTFDNHDAASTASSSNAAANTASPVSNSTSNSYWDHLPSEEEQLRQFREQDESSWSTVTDKKKLRRKKTQDAQANGDDVKEPIVNGKKLEEPVTNDHHTDFDFEKFRQADEAEWSVA